MDWFRLGFKRWLDTGGRSSRLEYVAFALTIYALLATGAVAGHFFGGIVSAIFGFIILGLLIVGIVPLFTITIRRLHDINLPGWLIVICYFVPGLNVLMVFLLSFIPGTQGQNNYGEKAGVPSEYLGKI